MEAVQIEWQPEKDYSCYGGKKDLRTYGEIAGQEVAMVCYVEFTARSGERITGWETSTYLKPWPRTLPALELAATKEEAQEKAQKAVQALADLLTTGEASPGFDWI